MLPLSLVFLLIFLCIGLPVAAVMGWLAILLDQIASSFPLSRAFGEIAWSHSNDFLLVAIPFYLLMGEILLGAGMAKRMYAAIAPLVRWLPGGLMHANIGASMAFAATSGSSIATAATIGTTAMPEIDRRGYNERLFLGSLAAGGTLGILIPPSINMVLYGFLTDTSIPALFLAGVVPGILLAGLFMSTILVACLINRTWDGTRDPEARLRLTSLLDLVPPAALFMAVVGSIYAGWATPTEAAALGVVLSLIIAAIYRELSWPMLRRAMLGAMRTAGMMVLITIMAFLLNFVIGSVGLVAAVNDLVAGLGWPPMLMMVVIIAIYIVLGMFMDTLAMIVLTIPIVTPIVVSLGFDPVWFGVIMVLIAETAVLTPPIGILCYVIQGIRRRGRLEDVFIGVAPFVGALFLAIVLMFVLPDLALWLPGQVYGR